MKNSPKFLPVVSLLILALACSLPAHADTIITIAAASGTDLSNVLVGDVITFDVFASTTDTVSESFSSYPDIHIFWDLFSQGTMNLLSFTFAPGVFNDFQTDPIIATATFQATGAGLDGVFIGWPDCTGLPTNDSGCAITNLGATRPADSNHINFTIGTPEPSSLQLAATGLLAFGILMLAFRRNTIA